ncbi:hypothetical protein AQI95_38895 [Streptomyces yokosukanensis]|uniref:Alkylmercury lyase n=2 Tax=Streptomyces yokosukanensis TaxID=67386 RepID=A0A117PZ10_9ACTN|nr:hypothetical protein AQI95_38895 [Streptomyces yokosukanensis]
MPLMRVEMVTVPDCPNGPVLRERLALALVGRTDVELTEHVVDDPPEAERRGMHGSPTLLVDGRDPYAASGAAASVSCHLCRGADGRIRGAPSVEELRRVLGTPVTGGAGRAGQGRLAPIEGGLRAVQQAVMPSFAVPAGQMLAVALRP